MRHKDKRKKIGRDKSHREALAANLARSLILNEYIVTTVEKAKIVKSYVDKVISQGKDNSLSSRRRLEKLLKDRLATDKVINVLSDRFKDRQGGYVQLFRMGKRKGDDSDMAKLVLIGSKPFKEKKQVKARSKRRKPVSKGKKRETQEVRKKESVLDRVKKIRSRLFGREKEKKVKGQTDRISKQVPMRSRSGI
jgi:large subunit ribosomal protein L17